MTDKPERKMKKKIFDKWFWPQSLSGVKFILPGKPLPPLSSAGVQWYIAWCDQILLPWFPSQTFSCIWWLIVVALQMHQLWADLSPLLYPSCHCLLCCISISTDNDEGNWNLFQNFESLLIPIPLPSSISVLWQGLSVLCSSSFWNGMMDAST